MKWFAFLLAGAVVIGGSGYWWWNIRVVPEKNAESSLRATKGETRDQALFEVPALSTKRIYESNPGARYTIDINYPEVSLATHPDLAKEANDVIRGFLRDTQAQFIEQTKELFSPDAPTSFSSDLTMNWSPLLVSPSLLSLRFEYSAYIAGAAHPDHRSRILNYDLPDHRLLSTTDLFASTTQALPFLSTFSRTALRARLSDEPEEVFQEESRLGTEPSHENFQEVGITEEGLLVIFNPYQVAAYARGTIQVPITLADLSSASGTPGLSSAVLDAIRLSKENFRAAEEEAPLPMPER